MTSLFKLSAVLSLVFFCGLSEAKSASQQEIYAAHSRDIVDAFNIIYPDLELSVSKPAAEHVLIYELEVLREAVQGNPVKPGYLQFLACKNPACGGNRI